MQYLQQQSQFIPLSDFLRVLQCIVKVFINCPDKYSLDLSDYKQSVLRTWFLIA